MFTKEELEKAEKAVIKLERRATTMRKNAKTFTDVSAANQMAARARFDRKTLELQGLKKTAA